MKNIMVCLIFQMFLITASYAQVIKGAAGLGFNITQVEGDEVYGFHKYGLNAGASAIIPLDERWSVSLETMYTEKGAYQHPRYAQPKNGSYMLRLNYAEVPVLVHFEDRETMTFGLGASWGRLVHMEEYEHLHRIPWQTLSGPYETNDFNIIVDVRFRLYQRFWGNFRYAYSLASIRSRKYTNIVGESWTREQYNQLISFRLFYIFNETLQAEDQK
ncbi:MAG: outer membrane beta-barrel protein [Bacteroidales bacterium]